MNVNGLRVGELARRAGVNLQTVHYYERRGLLPKPPRTPANYRAYPEDAVLRVRFVKEAQELGFSLSEIKDLLSLRATPRARCADVLERARAKVIVIEEKVARLRRMRAALVKLMAACESGLPIGQCAILEAIEHKEKRS